VTIPAPTVFRVEREILQKANVFEGLEAQGAGREVG